MSGRVGFDVAKFSIEDERKAINQSIDPSGLPALLKSEDQSFFGCLLDRSIDESVLDPAETNRRRVLRLLLKIKNGQPPQRKSALRIITDKAREFGAGPLFDAILPLLMSPSLDDSEQDRIFLSWWNFPYRHCQKEL